MIKLGASMTTDFSADKVMSQHEIAMKRALKGTAREYERLAQQYVPMLTGDLYKSAFRSPFEKGEIVYDTPYAKRIYYLPNETTNWTRDHHPQAMSHWGDFVKSKYINHLTKIFNMYYNGRTSL
jgi:hypothetical protein